MAKLLGSDYDGTLRINHEIEKTDLDAINKFRNMGNKFGIVTGRSIGMIEYEIKYFNIPIDFLICNNGGIAISADGKILFRHDIDFGIAQTFIRDITQHPSIMIGCSDGNKFASIQEGNIKDTTSNFNAILGNSYTDINKILKNKQINSFFLKDSTLSQTTALYQEIVQKYQNKLAFHFNNGTIDVSAPSVSKKNAITKVSNIYGITDVYAIGDGHNDIEMIKAYGGFTMGNAPDGVKQHASKIFENVRECVNFITAL